MQKLQIIGKKLIFISLILKWNAKMGHFLIHLPELWINRNHQKPETIRSSGKKVFILDQKINSLPLGRNSIAKVG